MNKPLEFETELNAWVDKEKQAVELISTLGQLLYNNSIELVLFRHHLVDMSVSEILKLHHDTKNFSNQEVSIYDTTELAKEILNHNLAPAKIDIGKLAVEWAKQSDKFSSKAEFIQSELGSFDHDAVKDLAPKDVVLYGFGRIGRIAARELVKQAGKGQQLRLRAIVTRGDNEVGMKKRAALLMNDSVHGAFKGSVSVDTDAKTLTINGQVIQLIHAKQPEDIDYTAYGINDALLIDNTGVFTDRAALGRHLSAKGISKVLLTAPGKEVPNIVYGVNHKDLNIEEENIFSAASCTTNAIVPPLKVIEDSLGVVKGHIETVHAYTNDQNLLDNMHKKNRRGRSAAINMVITETGAGKAVTKVIPSLQDKLTANAVRVPTPNGSLAIMNLTVGKEVDLDTLNNLMRKAALEGELVNQIFFSADPEMVSSDIIGNNCCSVFDSPATIVSNDNKNVVLYVWYDNEFGYTKQVIRLAKYIAQVRRLIYY